jgi:hypothetical protein
MLLRATGASPSRRKRSFGAFRLCHVEAVVAPFDPRGACWLKRSREMGDLSAKPPFGLPGDELRLKLKRVVPTARRDDDVAIAPASLYPS